MYVKLLPPQSGKKIIIVLFCIAAWLWTPLSAAQNNPRKPGPTRLPRVGKIKDGDNMGVSMPGCGNHTISWKEFDTTSIFMSNADGSNAWMNLDGHNTKLKFIKTTLYYLGEYQGARAYHEYRAGPVHITVSFIQVSDYISYYPAKIVLRKSGAIRTIRGVGSPQCD